VPKADLPEPDELHEIGRRLCARMGVKPREPITAVGLRRIIDERGHTIPKAGLVDALRACADALADQEQSPELRELREALDAYVDWLRRSEDAERRLCAAVASAMPLLDEEAASRAAALEAVEPTEAQRAQGAVPTIWPSPESLCGFPRVVAGLLPQVRHAVLWLRKTAQDLRRIDADPRVVLVEAQPRTRMAMALAREGYRPAEITTITHPFARTGAARSRARNAVVARLALRDDTIVPTIAIPSEAPNAEARLAALDDAARFVLGRGHEGLVVATSATESAVEADVTPPPDKSSKQRKKSIRGKPRAKR
jgi:hypothetical protein